MTIPTKVNLDNLITRLSILDQILISEGLQSEKTYVIPVDITDHYCVSFPSTVSYGFKQNKTIKY